MDERTCKIIAYTSTLLGIALLLFIDKPQVVHPSFSAEVINITKSSEYTIFQVAHTEYSTVIVKDPSLDIVKGEIIKITGERNGKAVYAAQITKT